MLNSPAPFFPPPSLSFHFLDPFPCRPPSFHPYHARNLGSTVNCSSGVPPVPPLLSYSPCPAHPSLPWSVLLTPSGGLGSAVNSPRGVRGRAPTANAFRYIQIPWNLTGGNNYGSLCANKMLPLHFLGGELPPKLPPLPLPAGAYGWHVTLWTALYEFALIA